MTRKGFHCCATCPKNHSLFLSNREKLKCSALCGFSGGQINFVHSFTAQFPSMKYNCPNNHHTPLLPAVLSVFLSSDLSASDCPNAAPGSQSQNLLLTSDKNFCGQLLFMADDFSRLWHGSPSKIHSTLWEIYLSTWSQDINSRKQKSGKPVADVPCAGCRTTFPGHRTASASPALSWANLADSNGND